MGFRGEAGPGQGILAGAILAGLALVAAGCDRDGGSRAGAATLFRLRTGECFHSRAGTSGRTVELDDLSPLPCGEAHDGEVFAVVAHPAAKGVPYPGDDALADFAGAECLGAFTAYTGSGYDDSDLEVAGIRPGRESWGRTDDREVGCVLYRRDGTLTGSRRKA